MDIKTALKLAEKILPAKKIASAGLDAEVLLSFVLKKDKTFLFAHPEKKLTPKEEKLFKNLMIKRAKSHWPVAYLTGHKEFFCLDFKITPHVLVPRPQTEDLVSQALNFIKQTKKRPLSIADIGTGSGVIIIALAKNLAASEPLKNFKFYATDISAKALLLATANARLHGCVKNIKFLRGSLLTPLQGLPIDLFLANLPYLQPQDLLEPSIKKEPRPALVGNYRKFFKQVKSLSRPASVIYENKTGIHLKRTAPV